jgi:hypothetical protein
VDIESCAGEFGWILDSTNHESGILAMRRGEDALDAQSRSISAICINRYMFNCLVNVECVFNIEVRLIFARFPSGFQCPLPGAWVMRFKSQVAFVFCRPHSVLPTSREPCRPWTDRIMQESPALRFQCEYANLSTQILTQRQHRDCDVRRDQDERFGQDAKGQPRRRQG